MAKLPQSPALSVGIVPIANFTMLALSGFVDTLRLAADVGDRSRPVRCRWTILSERCTPVMASNGIAIQPTAGLTDSRAFDYIVVVGGILHRDAGNDEAITDYLSGAAAAGIPLVGLCTGSFVLARAGLMRRRTTCVSWFHHDDFVAEFPGSPVISDRLFLDEGDRITCAGGVSVIHLASYLVDRHCGPGSAAKGLRIMIEEVGASGTTPQPSTHSFPLRAGSDTRVRRALLLMEQQLGEKLTLGDLAAAAGVTARQLTRLFDAELGVSPAAALVRLRVESAEHLIGTSDLRLSEIAAHCGFADSSHLSRVFKARYGVSPLGYRKQASRPARM